MVSFEPKPRYNIDDLLKIAELLRGEGGCPWDAKQTHKSMRQNMIEEAYEAAEAIDMENDEMMCEEFGDVLLQVVSNCRIAEERQGFNFDDVVNGVCQKLIERHPHVFGDIVVHSTGEVLDNWEKIKQHSKGQTKYTETLTSVPKTFPALMRCQKVQKRAAKSGFNYPDVTWALEALESEIKELKKAISAKDEENINEELGDIIFSAVNVSRILGADSETVALKSCDKFIRRFAKLENLAKAEGHNLDELDIDKMLKLWSEAKQNQILEENKND